MTTLINSNSFTNIGGQNTQNNGIIDQGEDQEFFRNTTDNDAYLRAYDYTPDVSSHQITSPKPDITLYCKECRRYIDLRLLHEHRTYHKSLQILLYKNGTTPENVDALLKRRNTVLRKLKQKSTGDNPLDPNVLQQVNDAYEFLKADLEDTYEAYRRFTENPSTDVRGVGLNCSAPCAFSVGICSDGNERWKSSMEDTRVFQDYFGNDPNKCFFAIYDGHHGKFAAEVAANEFHHALLMEMENFDPTTKCTCTFNMADSYDITHYDIHSRVSSRLSESAQIHEESTNFIHQIIKTCEDHLSEMASEDQGDETEKKTKKEKEKKTKDPFAEKMSYAFQKAHKYTDILLGYGKDEKSRVRWSGCSTLACVIQNKMPNESANEKGDSQEGEGASNENNEEKRVFGMDVDSTDDSSDTKPALKGEPPKELGVVHLANAGNVAALLVRANRIYRLSRDHTPYNTKENARVKKAGGRISESNRELRVNGVLATTRGLGNHGDVALKKCVLRDPHTTSVTIDQYAQFIVMASHGVWEVFSEDDVSQLLLQMLPSNHVPPPSRVSTSMQQLLHQLYHPSSLSNPLTTKGDAKTACSSSFTEPTFRQPIENAPLKSSMKKPSDSRQQSAKSKASVTIIEERIDGSIPEVISTEERQAEQSENTAQETLVKKAALEGEILGGGDMKVHGDENWSDLTSAKALQLELEIAQANHSDIEIDGDGESGNEADVDTVTDGLPPSRPSSSHIPTREEVHREYARCMAERLTQAALLAGAKDNITVMVILLPGSGL